MELECDHADKKNFYRILHELPTLNCDAVVQESAVDGNSTELPRL